MVEKEKDIVTEFREIATACRCDQQRFAQLSIEAVEEAADEIERLRTECTQTIRTQAKEIKRLRIIVEKYGVLDDLIMTGKTALDADELSRILHDCEDD